MITYKDTKEFTAEELERLFLSVGWESGRHPEKLRLGLQNSSVVISAWDGERLVGLIRGLDDGQTVGFIHCLPVDPATIPFYEKFGFHRYDNYSALERSNL